MRDAEIRWIEATQAAADGDYVLTGDQIRSWRTLGFTFVSGVLPSDLIDEMTAYAGHRYPAAGTAEAAKIADFGSAGQLSFPSQCAAFNAVTLHHRLLGAIAQLLDVATTDMRLTQSDLWPKYGRARSTTSPFDNDDQRIHVDYPNHTLAHPAPWERPEAVELIIYLDHVEDTGGATALVPRAGPDDPAYRWPIVDTPGIGELDYVNDRVQAEAYFAGERPQLADWRRSLYLREQRVHFRPGDVLFYRHDTWHRGTPLVAGSRRLVHNITYRKAAAEWISVLHVGWAWSAYRNNKFLERLIAGASLEQRAVLGFPQPGSHYWCPETIAAIEARYGVFGMDMSPYTAHLLGHIDPH